MDLPSPLKENKTDPMKPQRCFLQAGAGRGVWNVLCVPGTCDGKGTTVTGSLSGFHLSFLSLAQDKKPRCGKPRIKFQIHNSCPFDRTNGNGPKLHQRVVGYWIKISSEKRLHWRNNHPCKDLKDVLKWHFGDRVQWWPWQCWGTAWTS